MPIVAPKPPNTAERRESTDISFVDSPSLRRAEGPYPRGEDCARATSTKADRQKKTKLLGANPSKERRCCVNTGTPKAPPTKYGAKGRSGVTRSTQFPRSKDGTTHILLCLNVKKQ